MPPVDRRSPSRLELHQDAVVQHLDRQLVAARSGCRRSPAVPAHRVASGRRRYRRSTRSGPDGDAAGGHGGLGLGRRCARRSGRSRRPAPRRRRPRATPSARWSSVPTPPLAITGTPTASLTAAVSSRSKPSRVPSRSIEVSRISPAPRVAPPRPPTRRRRGRSGVRPPWVKTSQPGSPSPVRRRASMATTTHWAPNSVGHLADQLGPVDRGGVERHLVGAGPQQPAGVVDGADAAADRERDEHLLGGAGRRRRRSCRGRRTTR